MPARDRVRPDEEDRPAVTAEHASEHGEDRAVVGFEARTGDLALQHGELMTQHEDLDILGMLAPAAQHQQVDHEPDQTVEAGPTPILAAPQPHRSRQRETPGQRAGRVFGTHRGCRTNLCARVLDTRTWAARASRPPDVVVPASVEAIVRQPPQVSASSDGSPSLTQPRFRHPRDNLELSVWTRKG